MATLDDLNLNKFLYRITPTNESSIFNISKEEQKAINEVASENIMSGELMGNISLIDGFIQSKNFISGSIGWRLNNDGVIECQNAIIGGVITATSGDIGGWNIISGYIYSLASGTPASSPSDGIVLASGNKVIQVFENTEKRVEMGCLSAGVYGIKGYADDGITVLFELSDTQKLISGIPIQNIVSGTEISIQGWQQDMTFSATDEDTVAWSSGTITLLDGTTYSITGGNTGNMSVVTYIYFNKNVSLTTLQTTAAAGTAVGSGKIHICTAQNVVAGNLAIFQPLGGKALGGIGKLITADDIVSNTITANEIYSGYVYTGVVVADQITAGAGIINALSVLTTLTMGSATTTGTIQSYGWNGTANGYQLLGGATPSISLIGGTITGGTIQTAASGTRRFVMSDHYGATQFSYFRMLGVNDNMLLSIDDQYSSGYINIYPENRTGLFIQGSGGDQVYLNYDNVDGPDRNITAYNRGIGNAAAFLVVSNVNRESATVRIGAISGQGANIQLDPIANAPQSPTEGDIFAKTDHHIYYYNGTVWKQLDNA